MNRRQLLLLSPFALAGCHVSHSGPARTESMSVERDKAELVRAEFRIGAGELRVRGGATKLMEGEFKFAPDSWRPVMTYNNTGVRGLLKIEQPSSGSIVGNHENDWTVRLNDEVPLDVSVHFGAGEASLELGSLSLRSVEVHMGVGQMKVDLRGKPKRNYDVMLRGGVGEATIFLPAGVGLWADAKGGIGNIHVSGLRKEGDHWLNDAWDKAGTKVKVDVKGGVGEIKLLAE